MKPTDPTPPDLQRWPPKVGPARLDRGASSSDRAAAPPKRNPIKCRSGCSAYLSKAESSDEDFNEVYKAVEAGESWFQKTYAVCRGMVMAAQRMRTNCFVSDAIWCQGPFRDN
jgi:hypothetical protein